MNNIRGTLIKTIVTLKAIVATARSSAKMDAIASAVEKLRSVQKDLEKMKKDIEEVQKDSEKAQKEVGEIIGALNSIQRQPSPPPGYQPFTQQGQGHGQLSNRLEQRQSNSDGRSPARASTPIPMTGLATAGGDGEASIPRATQM